MSARIHTATVRRIGVRLASLCLGLALLSGTATAQAEQPFEVNIKAQDLSSALTAFGRQTKTEIAFTPDVVGSRRAPAVKGEMTRVEILETLLAETSLKYRYMDNGTVIVQNAGVDEESANDSKNLRSTPALMAQNQTNPAQTAVGGRNNDGGTSVVTGKVTDARTGANLKGALVRIEETGQEASTNDFGEYRFPVVSNGVYTLTVSYLGYGNQSTRIITTGGEARSDFNLRGGSDVEEIIVFGQRSARALALNQERTAKNFKTVISADFLGQFEGATIAESLRRAPGIAFEQSNRSGDGTNIVVRGLVSDFNMVTLNGLRLPVGNGRERSAALNNILTESVSNITISKTLLPSQDSTGTGGLVDIETKRPLDRANRFLSFNAQMGETVDDFREDYLLSATASGKFGEDKNFGASLSVQHRSNDVTSIRYNSIITGPLFQADFPYLPLASDGSVVTDPSQIDPRITFPFESGADTAYPRSLFTRYTRADVENSAATVSLQWRPADHTDLNFDYTYTKVKQSDFLRNVNFSAFTAYEELPVPELDGESRGALVWEDAAALFGLPGALASVSISHQLDEYEEATDLININGETRVNAWTISYAAGYAQAEREQPLLASLDVQPTVGMFGFVDVPREWLLPEAANNTINGRLVSPFLAINGRRGFILPAFNQTAFDFFNSDGNYSLNFLDIVSFGGENERSTAKVEVRRDFDHPNVRYLTVGGFFEKSRSISVIFPGYFVTAADDGTLPALGLPLSADNLAAIGINSGFSGITEREFAAFVRGATSNPDLSVIDRNARDFDERSLDAFLEEQNVALFLEGQVDFGRFEFVGGVRYDSIDVDSRNLTNPIIIDEFGVPDNEFAARFRTLVDQSASQNEILPRLLMNYRHSDNLIVRAGYYRSVARPKIRQLSSAQNISLNLRPTGGPNGNQPTLQIIEGNPDLKPAFTNSYDLSVEYYDENLGQLKASVFYKAIENFLEFNSNTGTDQLEGAVLPDERRFDMLPDNLFVRRVRPFNNDESANIWGAEFALEKRLAFLPGVFGGLGAFSNYTYTDSSKKIFGEFFDPALGETVEYSVDDVPFAGQPKHSGTIGLTYNGRSVDASLSYTRQDRRLRRTAPFSLYEFAEEDESLDFRATYFLDSQVGEWRFYVEGTDLLKGRRDPDVEVSIGGINGTPKFYGDGSFFGGRVFRFGVTSTFR